MRTISTLYTTATRTCPSHRLRTPDFLARQCPSRHLRRHVSHQVVIDQVLSALASRRRKLRRRKLASIPTVVSTTEALFSGPVECFSGTGPTPRTTKYSGTTAKHKGGNGPHIHTVTATGSWDDGVRYTRTQFRQRLHPD